MRGLRVLNAIFVLNLLMKHFKSWIWFHPGPFYFRRLG
mgnify:CR=1 FL=1